MFLSQTDMTTRQKLNKQTKEVTEVVTQMGLTDIFRTFHLNTKEYNFLSALHGTFCKCDHIPQNIENLHRYKRIGK